MKIRKSTFIKAIEHLVDEEVRMNRFFDNAQKEDCWGCCAALERVKANKIEFEFFNNLFNDGKWNGIFFWPSAEYTPRIIALQLCAEIAGDL